MCDKSADMFLWREKVQDVSLFPFFLCVRKSKNIKKRKKKKERLSVSESASLNINWNYHVIYFVFLFIFFVLVKSYQYWRKAPLVDRYRLGKKKGREEEDGDDV